MLRSCGRSCCVVVNTYMILTHLTVPVCARVRIFSACVRATIAWVGSSTLVAPSLSTTTYTTTTVLIAYSCTVLIPCRERQTRVLTTMSRQHHQRQRQRQRDETHRSDRDVRMQACGQVARSGASDTDRTETHVCKRVCRVPRRVKTSLRLACDTATPVACPCPSLQSHQPCMNEV